MLFILTKINNELKGRKKLTKKYSGLLIQHTQNSLVLFWVCKDIGFKHTLPNRI